MRSICPVFKWLGCPVIKWHSNTGTLGIQPPFDHSNTKLVQYSDPHCTFIETMTLVVRMQMTFTKTTDLYQILKMLSPESKTIKNPSKRHVWLCLSKPLKNYKNSLNSYFIHAWTKKFSQRDLTYTHPKLWSFKERHKCEGTFSWALK